MGGDDMDLQQQTQGQNVQGTLFDLEELAVKTTTAIERLTEQLRVAKQMLKDAYKASETYTSQEGRVQAEKKMLQDIKQELDGQQEFKGMLATVRDLQTEVKEKKTSVSDYAIEYQRMSGNNQIERSDGTYEIQTVAKLVKRK